MPYGGTAPELDPPDDDVPEDPPDEDAPDEPPEDDPPDDEAPDDEPPDDDVDEDEELDVSSLPPHAAIAVALANKIAARVATRPVGAVTTTGVSAASQNGHAVSLART